MREDGSVAFPRFLSAIYTKSPLQKKAVQSFLEKQDSLFWQRAEDFSERMLSLLETQDLSVEYVVNSYLKMCRDMLIEQIRFKKTGRYTLQNASQVKAQIYSSEKEMASYMYGLALSYFLWQNHYALFDFFISESKKLQNVTSYLEIGPGHGLFLVESIRNFPEANFCAVDISPTSERISKAIVEYFTQGPKCHFQVKDVNNLKDVKYDFIVMCEVLEHLDCPIATLKRVHALLKDEGHLFITTCANCPAIDHIYLYESISHIRREIHKSGFNIISDLALPVGDFPEKEWEVNKVEVNYGAMLRKA
jgi:2-polyprenyl-3-methyl-5-hydroxy-6-metoxy-1,4-benzoquinol methylase